MKPGRPPLDKDDPSAQISVTLPSKQLATICAAAKSERLTMAEWIRRMLRHGATEKKNEN